MSPQFVDINGDSHTDILTATFDGSPHVVYGASDGFGAPTVLKDVNGKRIIITSFWNYDDEEHQEDDRAMISKTRVKERCISALAFDWDTDGDYDLLLGSYENGHLYRQMNEGTNARPKFSGQNIPVMAGESPFTVQGKMTSPRLVDWDGDGDQDLVAGSFGDSFGEGTGGAVYLFLNTGKLGAPQFSAPSTLIRPSPKGHTQLTRPDAGLYVDVVDFDSDGDLDLIVGAYSIWKPAPRELSAEEQTLLAQLKQEQQVLQVEINDRRTVHSKRITEATTGLERRSDEYRAKVAPINAAYRKDIEGPSMRQLMLKDKIDKLEPSKHREAFVWLYERK